jgi:REP element-mobilizing transposase RayT
LGDVIRAFKAVSTHQIRSKRLAFGVWQRNYYDRIIRSERELDAVRAYIRNNPEQWNKDEYH